MFSLEKQIEKRLLKFGLKNPERAVNTMENQKKGTRTAIQS